MDGKLLLLYKVERPEIEAWDFDEYVRILNAARTAGEDWYAAVCLAGEAGLRLGEVKALRWREDVDMVRNLDGSDGASKGTVQAQRWPARRLSIERRR